MGDSDQSRLVQELQEAGIKVVDELVRYDDGEATLHSDLGSVCRSLAEGWGAAPEAELDMTTIKGGITNMLYRVTWSAAPAGTPPSLLVRVFGAKTDIMIDRLKDNTVFAELGALSFGPSFHGAFRNGRIEGWREMRPLGPEEMGAPRFLSGIARRLALMHSLRPACLAGPAAQAPELWATCDRWLASVLELRFDGGGEGAGGCTGTSAADAAKAAVLARLDLGNLSRELEWLKTKLPPLAGGGRRSSSAPVDAAWAFASQVVFSHHDLLGGNILCHPDDAVAANPATCSADEVLFIDFEYGGFDFRGFDLANHFCEYAGYDFDVEKWYPSKTTQLAFCRAYVAAAGGVPAAAGLEAGAQDEFFEALYEIVCRFALSSNFYWGLWAIIQARHSPIDFDFMEYARIRFKGYFYQKGLWANELYEVGES